MCILVLHELIDGDVTSLIVVGSSQQLWVHSKGLLLLDLYSVDDEALVVVRFLVPHLHVFLLHLLIHYQSLHPSSIKPI